jgi:hypothetical protein
MSGRFHLQRKEFAMDTGYGAEWDPETSGALWWKIQIYTSEIILIFGHFSWFTGFPKPNSETSIYIYITNNKNCTILLCSGDTPNSGSRSTVGPRSTICPSCYRDLCSDYTPHNHPEEVAKEYNSRKQRTESWGWTLHKKVKPSL